MATVERLTSGRIRDFGCREGKAQDFLWAQKPPGLGLRATASGNKAFVFQGVFAGDKPRMTIGSIDTWTIQRAEKRARELQHLIDTGRDPREVKAERVAADKAARDAKATVELQTADAWEVYLREGKPKRKAAWKPRYLADLRKAAASGGAPKTRGKGKTKPGHLAALLALPLSAFGPSTGRDTIDDWYAKERKRAPVQAKRAAAMFAGFLSWCASRKEYRNIIDPTCARASMLRDAPPNKPRTDALELAQLPAWFAGVDKLPNRTAAAYLKGLLLTGARREELATLRWANVDFRWKKLTIADKVDDTRTIPLTPYMAFLLSNLPRKNGFVFASDQSKSGRISEPRSPHEEVLADAGIAHVSIHGLRRSFALLGEAAGAPAGAIAQVMGHRPSAVAEGYKPRSIDGLRPYLAQVEKFILSSAGVEFDANTAVHGALRMVKA
jgi:integrase